VTDQPLAQTVPSRRKRLVILGICSMSLLIVGLDSTIVKRRAAVDSAVVALVVGGTAVDG